MLNQVTRDCSSEKINIKKALVRHQIGWEIIFEIVSMSDKTMK